MSWSFVSLPTETTNLKAESERYSRLEDDSGVDLITLFSSCTGFSSVAKKRFVSYKV